MPISSHPSLDTATALDVVHTIYDYRFLTLRQFRRLRPQLRPAELSRLVRTRHLATIRRPTIGSRASEAVYALDRRGADLLTEALDVDRAQLRWRAQRNLIGLLFLDHRLAVNDVRIALTVAAERGRGELLHWYNEPAIEEDVQDPIDPFGRLAFRPDAYMRLLLPTGRVLHAFVEVDRSSEAYAKIAGKVRRYLAYKDSRLFRSRVGARAFRVLFTVPSVRRLRSLKRVIEEAEGRRMFWLARQAEVADANLEDRIWHLAGGDEQASLLGPPPLASEL